MTYLDTENQDKWFLAFMAIRLFIYFVFMTVNFGQAFIEAREMTLRKVNSKFFMFLAFALFCLCRCISQALFFWRPEEYLVGTIYYVFFSFGNFFIFQEFIFLGGFWIQLLYSFFISSKIRRKGVGRLHKMSNYNHYDDMMHRTKSILSIVVCSVSSTLIYNIVFIIVDGDGTPPYTLFPIRLIITGIIDIGQMIAIMVVMADGLFHKYFLFIRVSRFQPSDKSSASDATDAKLGSMGTKTTHYDGASNMSFNTSMTSLQASNVQQPQEEEEEEEEQVVGQQQLNETTISIGSSNPNIQLIKEGDSSDDSSKTQGTSSAASPCIV
ncbi:hypothetical protein DFA_09474 [Cavenderia fasciculata]|uniref:THH1/TOM1/TOM3 domain-containing protein n=1 Tax=Cavenderia fasciculata TaxID=261658 RepID=F4Q7Q6_CACFS|nr:uncharacterized protein DFA_09474 [Cavenderia fasciculata]EGG15806.1 hypothetical protein DFA_09474 [Cavenderia fasciculata]|eukprot:XP_004352131.1 hypothetical protein DFA_09474 [Cavenderia fasciculata]